MNTKRESYLGIDIGSVSLNLAIIDKDGQLIKTVYRRTQGQPLLVLLQTLQDIQGNMPEIRGALVTGSGRDLISDILGIPAENEIITQAKGTTHFYPETRTIIEIGGQDSKLIFLSPDRKNGTSIIKDHALNEICAAGTGSFLDQQAFRLGISIEEFADLALRSKSPAVIAGRCSVFAKTDMIHLQQEATAKEDIVAGLCYALARNYISNLGKGKQFERPILFQGGVAANMGVGKALESLLGLEKGELIVPQHFDVMGAFGAALMARENTDCRGFITSQATEILQRHLEAREKIQRKTHLKPLRTTGNDSQPNDHSVTLKREAKKKAYVGIDIGAVSTKIVVLDEDQNLLARQYIISQGEPIKAVIEGLGHIGHEIEDAIEVQGIGVTGSGRYFVGDLVEADLVVNEITAQARAAWKVNSRVDTIFEIGGQDSKFIQLDNGLVADFEMNKVCAAGTGSFLQEQAERLGIDLEREFSCSAFNSKAPVDLGTRCTVFMESDLIHHQQTGSSKTDLLAGLAYAIANNYLEKVVTNKKIGEKIFFQGGVAGNKAVASAFEAILGKSIIVPENYDVSGAIGAALLVQDKRKETVGKSTFAGFNLSDREYTATSFECQHCPNCCQIKKVSIEGKPASFYGSICERYLVERKKPEQFNAWDLVREREEILVESYQPKKEIDPSSLVVGIPQMLMFFEQFPLWNTFFQELGISIVISDKSNRSLIHKGLQKVLAETCYPVKIAYGHIINLIEKGAQYIFLPSVIDLRKEHNDVNRSYNCPYIQGLPFMLKPAFEDKVEFISPIIYMAQEKENIRKEMIQLGKRFGKRQIDIKKAIKAAFNAQEEFKRRRHIRGAEALESITGKRKAMVLVGKPYNLYDPGLNLHIPRKLHRLGIPTIPIDYLPLDDVNLPPYYSNLVWKNEQTLLRAAHFIKEHKNLYPIMITNYGCGPDAFFMKYLEDTMDGDPYLIVEVDEHSADAGVITRIEAFLDTIQGKEKTLSQRKEVDMSVVRPSRERNLFIPSRKIKNLGRTIYIFYLSAHSHVMAAAFQSVGIDARVIPPPDEQSEELGRRYASGKECHPYLLTTGDMVRATQSTDFDPDRSAFLMLNFDGSCRLSQYGLSQKLVLKKLGLEQIPILAPVTSIRWDEATRLFGLNWAMSLWKGFLGVDVLLKMLLHTRPYEINRGESGNVFNRAVEALLSGIIQRDFEEALVKGLKSMTHIPVNRSAEKPIIGIVGEIYSCINPWANNGIIETLEGLGAEVRLGPTLLDYTAYFNECYPQMRFSQRRYLESLLYYLRKTWCLNRLDHIEGMMGEDLKDCKISRVKEIIEMARPYVSEAIDPVVTVNVARAKDYARKGVSGIANLIILNCLYGTLSTAIYKKIQREYGGLPILNMIYDGLKQTNEKTRIEAFLHQAKTYISQG